jgi:hypothetical protein
MKKTTFLLILVLALGFIQLDAQRAPAEATKTADYSFSVTLGGGVRMFTGDEDDVYDFVNPVFALDVAYKFNKSLEIFLHGEYLMATGELTITKEETTMNIIPAELGARYLFGSKSLNIYLGAGLGYYFITEENPIGTVNESNIGFLVEAGIRPFFTQNIFLDVKLKFVSLSVKPEDKSVSLGGLSLLVGLGFAF